MNQQNLAAIVSIICATAGITTLKPEEDIYDAGLTSIQALPLLMDLEDRFGVTIPDDQFVNARSAAEILVIIESVGVGGSSAS